MVRQLIAAIIRYCALFGMLDVVTYKLSLRTTFQNNKVGVLNRALSLLSFLTNIENGQRELGLQWSKLPDEFGGRRRGLDRTYRLTNCSVRYRSKYL